MFNCLLAQGIIPFQSSGRLLFVLGYFLGKQRGEHVLAGVPVHLDDLLVDEV